LQHAAIKNARSEVHPATTLGTLSASVFRWLGDHRLGGIEQATIKEAAMMWCSSPCS
jgi:hypothetical protein